MWNRNTECFALEIAIDRAANTCSVGYTRAARLAAQHSRCVAGRVSPLRNRCRWGLMGQLHTLSRRAYTGAYAMPCRRCVRPSRLPH